MASKLIRDECKVGEAITAAGRTWACEIASRRAGQFTGLGLGGPQVEASVCLTIERDMSALAVRGQRLQDADTVVDEAERAEPGQQARRDEVNQRTLRGLVQVREVVTAVAGEAAARDLGFVGSTPRDPVAVEEVTGRVLGSVATVKLTAQLPGVTLDIGPATAALAVDHKALVQANADVLEGKRRTQLARARRDELWGEYTRERAAAAGRLDSELRAVGLDDAADRLVPLTRKASAAEATAGDGAAKDGAAKVSLKRPEKGAKAGAAKPAEVAKPAEPVVTTPAINTRPSQSPASPS